MSSVVLDPNVVLYPASKVQVVIGTIVSKESHITEKEIVSGGYVVWNSLGKGKFGIESLPFSQEATE